MKVSVNKFAAYDGYFTNEKLNSTISVVELDISFVIKEISHFPAINV